MRTQAVACSRKHTQQQLTQASRLHTRRAFAGHRPTPSAPGPVKSDGAARMPRGYVAVGLGACWGVGWRSEGDHERDGASLHTPASGLLCTFVAGPRPARPSACCQRPEACCQHTAQPTSTHNCTHQATKEAGCRQHATATAYGSSSKRQAGRHSAPLAAASPQETIPAAPKKQPRPRPTRSTQYFKITTGTESGNKTSAGCLPHRLKAARPPQAPRLVDCRLLISIGDPRGRCQRMADVLFLHMRWAGSSCCLFQNMHSNTACVLLQQK